MSNDIADENKGNDERGTNILRAWVVDGDLGITARLSWYYVSAPALRSIPVFACCLTPQHRYTIFYAALYGSEKFFDSQTCIQSVYSS